MVCHGADTSHRLGVRRAGFKSQPCSVTWAEVLTLCKPPDQSSSQGITQSILRTSEGINLVDCSRMVTIPLFTGLTHPLLCPVESDAFMRSVLGALTPPVAPPWPSLPAMGTLEVTVPAQSPRLFVQTGHTRILPPAAILFKQQVVLTFGKTFLGSILNCSQNMSPEPPTFSTGTGVYRFDFMLS